MYKLMANKLVTTLGLNFGLLVQWSRALYLAYPEKGANPPKTWETIRERLEDAHTQSGVGLPLAVNMTLLKTEGALSEKRCRAKVRGTKFQDYRLEAFKARAPRKIYFSNRY